MTFVRNPPSSDAAYLEALNKCFGQWGDAAQWKWVFERPCGGPAADRFIVTDDAGEWLAGSAISWRNLQIAGGGRTLVGIMTGSWTLAAARGKGCFTRIIEESVKWSTERGAGLLLAFVTHSNASYRRLEAAGSLLFPSRYVFSTSDTPPVADPASHTVLTDPDAAALARLEERAVELSKGRTTFAYGKGEWRGQFLERPSPTAILDVPGAGQAILETHDDTVRVQGFYPDDPSKQRQLVGAALAYAQASERKLFYFVSGLPGAVELAQGFGLSGTAGSVTALAADRKALAAALGDRKLGDDISALGPGKAATIAPLFVQSGDRM